MCFVFERGKRCVKQVAPFWGSQQHKCKMATGKKRDRDGGGGKYDMCNEVLIGAQIMPMSVSDSVAHAKCQSETFIAHTHFVAAAAAAYA